ncbi:MAG: hypothetical protein K0R72_864 [Clostridia bacterium]|jgi:drug/metabolite transporter (DMT)-like permease|nr:hypothetical protein [Clostridia bacterium]
MKYIIITICFIVSYCGFGAINFYQAKNVEPSIRNLILYNLCIIPITFIMNLIVTFTFNKGYKAVGEMLPITIIYLAVGVFSYVIVNYIFFKEIPKLNQLIAIVLVFIALILCNIKGK